MFDLLLGGPGETRATIARAIEALRAIDPDAVGVTLGLRLYRGTRLADALAPPDRPARAGVRAADWEAGMLYADANHNNIVTLSELYCYAKPRVAANSVLKRAGVKQSVRVWPAGSTFPVVQRTP
jgi:hypothetical protein